MRKIALTKKMRLYIAKVCSCIGDEPLTHDQMKALVGKDWNIRVMFQYIRGYGVMYDYSIKRWRRHKSVVTFAEKVDRLYGYEQFGGDMSSCFEQE